MPKKRSSRQPCKKISWKDVIIFIIAGYILLSAMQSVFCGAKSVSACGAWLWAIPVWIILGIIYFIKLKK
jgi:hypothetical protein